MAEGKAIYQWQQEVRRAKDWMVAPNRERLFPDDTMFQTMLQALELVDPQVISTHGVTVGITPEAPRA